MGFFETNISLRKTTLRNYTHISFLWLCIDQNSLWAKPKDHNKDLRILLLLGNVRSSTSRNHSPQKRHFDRARCSFKRESTSCVLCSNITFLNYKIFKYCYVSNCLSWNSYAKVQHPVSQMWPHLEVGCN